MAPLYDILTAEADYAANRIRRKDYKLAMRWGDSGNYKIVDIFKRHMLETGVAGGLSRTLVEEVLSEIVSEASGALEKTIAALPKGFPQVLVDVVAVAIKDRLQRLT